MIPDDHDAEQGDFDSCRSAGATRSTGRIQEGLLSYLLVTLRGEGASWHFQTLRATLAEVLRHALVSLASRLHPQVVACGCAEESVDVLSRPAYLSPERGPPVALGRSAPAIVAWPVRGILGTRLGPNGNGGVS